MRLRDRSKLLMMLLLVAAVAVITVIPGKAASYTPVAGGTTTFKKYLVMDKGASVPEVTFNFTIEPGQAISKTDTTMEVKAGIGTPTVGTASFTGTGASADATYDAVQTNDSLALNSGEKYAKKDVTIDFRSVSFTEPGVYRYTLKETKGTATGIGYDETEYTLDVYVTDASDNSGLKLKVEDDSYILHTGTAAPTLGTDNGSNDQRLSTKVDGIKNTYTTRNLFVGKVVTGNQGSKDKYFAVTVKIENLPADTVLGVSIDDDRTNGTADGNADITSGANAATIADNARKTNPTELAANTSGKAEGTFYLQHGQYVAITGITSGATYAVSENEEDYKKTEGAATLTVKGVDGDDHALSNPVSGTIRTSDIYTGFTNTRNGIIPTGVLLSITPWVVLGLVVIAGIIFFAVRSKKRYAEE